MKYFDLIYKITVILLLFFILRQQMYQSKVAGFPDSITVSGGKINAFIINDEKSKIPVDAEVSPETQLNVNVKNSRYSIGDDGPIPVEIIR